MAGKIKCPNCGELDTVNMHRDDDEYVWNDELHRYEPADVFPMQHCFRCPKCDAEVEGEWDGDGIQSVGDSLEGGDIDGEEENHSSKA